MGTLDAKTAFITGAARGQGRSHALRLAAEGANIIAVDICRPIESVPYPLATPEDLAETVRQVEALGSRIFGAEADVRDRRSLQRALDQGVAHVGPPEIVIANAGIAPLAIQEHPDVWADVIGVNLTGAFNTVAVALPGMISLGRGGSIVFISSTAGLLGILGGYDSGLSYTASKHGVVGLMRAYANRLAHYSIRVNSIHPTGVNTTMVDNDSVRQVIESDGSLAGPLGNALPVSAVEPIDISNAIAWLVSEEGRYITGVTLPVDAGFINNR